MAITWEQESTDLLVAKINGELVQKEMRQFQEEIAPVIQASGKLGFLVILQEFGGWETGKGWEDTSFADANDQHLSRFALVGEEQWRDQTLMFTLAGMRPVEIQYFTAEAEARAWLTQQTD
jgi:hypothetical protein